MLINLPQPGHPDPAAKLVQDAHAGHLRLTAQSGKLPPRPLLRQHFDQQVQGMHRRKQTQQMHPIKLCRAVIPPLAAGRTGRPAGVDEIVWNKRIHQFKQGDRAGRRKVGIHARQPIAGNPTRQQQCPTPLISVALHCLTTDCKNFRNTLLEPQIVIAMNLEDQKLASLGKLSVSIHNSADVHSFWLESGGYRSLLIHSWHFAWWVGNDIADYYDPICDAIHHSGMVADAEQPVGGNQI